MRIAFDVSFVQKQRAGIGRYALEILEGLLGTDSSNEYVLHGWSFSLDQGEIHRFKRPNVVFHLAKIPGAVKRAYWNRLQFPPIERLLGRLDVFHSCDPFVPPMKKCLGIVTVHDLSQKKFPRFFERRVLRWDRYLRDSLQRAAAVVVPSNSTKNDLLEMFNVTEEKVHVVPTPVNASFRREPILGFDGHVGEKFRLESPFALSVGTLEPRKNILSVVRAFELVHRAHNTPLRLVLVGKRGWMYQEIFEAIRASPVGGLVRYLGYISDDELASVYRQAQVFVYPSFYEGYGFPVLEAMVSGTPVVTSRNSSLEEIAQGAAFLIDPRSTEELANAMYTLSEDSSRRSELIFAGLQRARQCSPQIASSQILRIYESLNLF